MLLLIYNENSEVNKFHDRGKETTLHYQRALEVLLRTLRALVRLKKIFAKEVIKKNDGTWTGDSQPMTKNVDGEMII